MDKINLNKGLPKLRQQWIFERGDVEFIEGRKVKPEDNGILAAGAKASAPEFDLSDFKILRAKDAKLQLNLLMRVRASSPKKWNMWRYEKICVAKS